MKHLYQFARRMAAAVLALALCFCLLAPAASAATTIGGADTTLVPAEEENCLSRNCRSCWQAPLPCPT